MRIPRPILDDLVAHAREDAPNECCGMIGAVDGIATTLYRADNDEASPLRYSIDPGDQYRIMMQIDDGGEELGAIYHSHTRSPAYPSQTDINLAFYPDAEYVIVSVAEEEPEVRSFWIRDGVIEEADLEIA